MEFSRGMTRKKGKKPFATFLTYTSLPPYIFIIYVLRHREKFVCTLNQYFHTLEVKGLDYSAKHTVGLNKRIISVNCLSTGESCDVTCNYYQVLYYFRLVVILVY